MDLGDTPDIIHPERKRKLLAGDHPIGQHPSLAQEQQAKLAAHGYKQTMSQMARYTGRMPGSRDEALSGAGDAFGTLRQLVQRERRHKSDLEKLAVETVLRLPEFKSLRAPLEAGEFVIKAVLGPARLKKAKLSYDQEDSDENTEQEVPEIKQELDASIQRRHLTNAFVQGAAISNNYAFTYYTADELNQIDPSLMPDYGKLMAYSQIGYWVYDDSVMHAAASSHGGEAQLGSNEISFQTDVPTIEAYGLVFPVLVHELVKALMEFLSFNDEEDRETRKKVLDKADFLGSETWSMLLGPGLWKQFLDAVGVESRTLVPYLYDQLVKMPDSQFNALMKGIVEGTPQAKQQLKLMADEVRAKLGDDQEESQAEQIVNQLLS